MCGWHEDFEDEPSVEERFPDDQFDDRTDEERDPGDEPEDQFRDDVEADADTLASAGYGTDEDYGGYELGGEG
jgi:hypothetical protein